MVSLRNLLRMSIVCGTVCCAALVVAQFGESSSETVREEPRAEPPRATRWRPEPMPLRSDFPTWQVQPEFRHDVFTFVRIEFDSYGPFGWWDRWDNDYPSGDWNFSQRLQQLTALQVAPNGRVLRLTDPALFDHPFIYMAGVQTMVLSRAEKTALRRYFPSCRHD